jgi:GTPase SAR1 family protein
MKEMIGAVDYVECSALTGEGVREVFEHATRAALVKPPKKKRVNCRSSIKTRLFGSQGSGQAFEKLVDNEA